MFNLKLIRSRQLWSLTIFGTYFELLDWIYNAAEASLVHFTSNVYWILCTYLAASDTESWAHDVFCIRCVSRSQSWWGSLSIMYDEIFVHRHHPTRTCRWFLSTRPIAWLLLRWLSQACFIDLFYLLAFELDFTPDALSRLAGKSSIDHHLLTHVRCIH